MGVSRFALSPEDGLANLRSLLAEFGERGEDIDVGRAEQARRRAEERMKAIKDEEGYSAAHLSYIRAVTRLAVARKQRGGS
jgi:F-type H+-transporting ATPase subunit epsilon